MHVHVLATKEKQYKNTEISCFWAESKDRPFFQHSLATPHSAARDRTFALAITRAMLHHGLCQDSMMLHAERDDVRDLPPQLVPISTDFR